MILNPVEEEDVYTGCGRVLPHSFFERDTVRVARELLGQEIVRGQGTKRLCVRIVETEAYLEKGDPAAHCSRGPTPRAKVMFGEAGRVYVYFIYGNYYMLNFVTEKVGRAGAVLIRAVEPLKGLAAMAKRRGLENLKGASPKQIRQLTNGPAKLVMALGIDGSLNEERLGSAKIAVFEGRKPVKQNEIVTTKRVGINVGKDLPLRFYEKGNPFVSKV